MRKFFISKKSFTLIEILISVGIIAIISSFAFLELAGYRNQNNFNLDVQSVSEAIRTVQNRSINQENGLSWGLRFINTATSSDYQIFSGGDYSTSSVVVEELLDPASQFSNPASGLAKTTLFSAVYGRPVAADSVTLKYNGGSLISTIYVSSQGKINVIKDDGSLIGYWPMDEGPGTVVNDASGYKNNGNPNSSVWSNPSSCRVSSCLTFVSASGDTYVTASNLTVDTNVNATNTVAFWMYWTGNQMQIPFGFNSYGLYFANNAFGFDTDCGGDLYGATLASASISANTWFHVVAEFANGDVSKNSLYINGAKQALSQITGTSCGRVASSNIVIGTWPATGSWFDGRVDDFRIYNRALSDADILNLYNSY